MNFVNNYREPLTLALGATSADLSLPDGTYRLTLTDSQAAPTRWEIIDAVVVGGTGTLTRGLEGTDDQPWPEGSVIYSTMTAGLLQIMFARLLPAGGEAGQLLAKTSAADFDVQWVDANSEQGIGGALSGRLFIAYTDAADSTRKAAVLDLVTGILVEVESWANLLTDLAPGVLSYSVSQAMLATFTPGGTGMQLLANPDFSDYTFTEDVADGSGALWKPGAPMLLAVKHGQYIKPFNFYTDAYPRLQLALGGDGAIAGVSPSVMPVFSPDGTYLYVPTGAGIERRNGSTFALIDTVLDEQIYQFALSADGSVAAVRSYNFSTYEISIRLVDTSDWSVLATFSGYDQPAVVGDMTVRMAFNPSNAQQLAVAVQSSLSGSDVACVVLDHTSPGTDIQLSPAADYDPSAWAGEQVAWSPQGDRLYVACSVGLHAYSTADWSYVGTLPSIETGTPLTLP
tara:strand:+ start:18983 stop:20350 length:1368 start_codon:yes stop_codon:yes gene_type:complete